MHQQIVSVQNAKRQRKYLNLKEKEVLSCVIFNHSRATDRNVLYKYVMRLNAAYFLKIEVNIYSYKKVKSFTNYRQSTLATLV